MQLVLELGQLFVGAHHGRCHRVVHLARSVLAGHLRAIGIRLELVDGLDKGLLIFSAFQTRVAFARLVVQLLDRLL